MSISQIPMDESGALFWTQTTTLDGTAYLLTFRYNSREQAYYLQIQSADGATTFAQGLKLVANYPLLQTYHTPPGQMMALTLGADDTSPRPGDWGSRALLVYFDQADIIADGSEPQHNPFL